MDEPITLYVIAVQGRSSDGTPQFHVDFDVNAIPGGMYDADLSAKEAYLRKHPTHGCLATAIMAIANGMEVTGSDGHCYRVTLEPCVTPSSPVC